MISNLHQNYTNKEKDELENVKIKYNALNDNENSVWVILREALAKEIIPKKFPRW